MPAMVLSSTSDYTFSERYKAFYRERDYHVGDAKEPRKITDAVIEGFDMALGI